MCVDSEPAGFRESTLQVTSHQRHPAATSLRHSASMGRTRRQGIDAPTCGECGHTPHPERRRLALAKLTAVFPIELALHLLVLWLHPPLLATAALLAVTTTALVIWVVEPSAMRLLARWLNAPAARAQDHLLRAESLWRVRVTLRDTPGELEAVAV